MSEKERRSNSRSGIGWCLAAPVCALLSCVDKAHAVALVLEIPGNRKKLPATLLTLTLVRWQADSPWSDGYTHGISPDRHGVGHGIGRSIDHKDEIGGVEASDISVGSVRSDGQTLRVVPNPAER